MIVKLKSKLWVWLHCKRVNELFTCAWHIEYRKCGAEQIYLYPIVLSHAGKYVDAVLVDKNALGVLSDAAYKIKVDEHQLWVPNWFIKEVYND